jgi:diguanylate cyclase (GGDEF)-like protein
LQTGFSFFTMKRFIAATAIIFGLLSAAWAQYPSVGLSTLHAVKELTNAEAGKGLPVAFEGTVTYYNRADIDLFVQDGSEAVYVQTKPNQDLVPGDLVMVRGETRASFRPDIVNGTVTRIRAGSLPKPVAANFEQLVRAEVDCLRVTVRATVRSADRVNYGHLPSVDLKLLMDGGYIDATVIGGGAMDLKSLLDSEVEVTGVAAGVFDSKNQLTGIMLEVSTLDQIKVVRPARLNADLLPVTPMDTVLSSYAVRDLTSRVHVQGSITYYQPGSAVVLQNGSRSLWIMTQFEGPLRVGDQADVTGFPAVSDAALTLIHGEIQDSGIAAPLVPMHVNGGELASGIHSFDLVTAEGTVQTSAREAAQDEYVLTTDDGKIFSAIFRHPDSSGTSLLPPMKAVSGGSRIRVTGICVLQYGSDPFHGPVAVDVLLRSFDDVTPLAGPTLLNVRNLAVAAGGLCVLFLLAGIKGWTLDRKIRRQTVELAYIERRRSRILEDINGTRPLAEIIEQITELVSFHLKGAPSWCQIAEGAKLGNCPPKLDHFRIIEDEIPARSGSMLGIIYVALDPLTKPGGSEREALSMATALSALAIETRRLYTDLRRRSEFDLLTDTHNRFSLDKHLDALIAEAREAAGIFGLIYIDLNEFKQINDVYGHQAGDVYLREVSRRMKRQLRPFDTLARLGGDEFAVLVPIVRSRAEVAEIANRLERAFDDEFNIDGYTIRGSASVGIALYPQDGATKDALLNTADTAMYSAKNSSR